MSTLWNNLRYAARMLANSPAFSAAAIVTLALGIGANTAIFSLLNALVLKTLPVRDPAGLWLVGRGINCCVNGGVQSNFDLFPYPLYQQVRNQKELFSDLAAFTASNASIRIRIRNDASIAAQAKVVSANYFRVLGAEPALGRGFRPEEEASPQAVTVVSYRFWQRALRGDPAAVGQIINVNGDAFTIVGVAPPRFFGETVQTDPPDLWFPLSMQPRAMSRSSLLAEPDTYWLYLMGRLSPGATPELVANQITEEARAWMQEYEREDRDQIERSTVRLTPAATGISRLGRRYREPLRMLMFTVALVLLIACANVANLFLARAESRQKEMATRVALGATRLRLLGQLLTESMLVAFLGGAAGMLLALWGTEGLIAMAFRGAEYVPISPTPDLRVMAFLAAVCTVVGVLFGVAPAWRSSRTDLFHTLHPGGTSLKVRGFSLSKLLVVVQIASCLILVVGALLFIRSFVRLEMQDFGFEQNAVLDVRLDPEGTSYTPEQLPVVSKRMLRIAEGVPGVQSAALALYAPFSGDNSEWSLEVAGYTGSATPYGRWNRVTPGFFAAMGMRLLAGRGITETDGAGGRQIAVISESFAREYFAGRNPLGQVFRFRNTPRPTDTYEIVGIVSDMKYESAREQISPTFYLPLLELTPLDRGETRISRLFPHALIVRTSTEAAIVGEQLRTALRSEEPEMPVGTVLTMGERVGRALTQDQTMTALSVAFGGLALVLACVGLYGLMAYGVARRTREFGIRMALGARPRRVLQVVLGEGMWLVAMGLVLGMTGVWSSVRLAASQLYGVEPYDPRSVFLAAGGLVFVSAIAAYLAARRATQVDPMVALRHE